MVGLGGALSLRDHLPYETQCVGEAQPTRGKSSLFSRLYHHRPEHVVGYEQTVDLLHDTDSFLGANGRVRGTLVALYLVHGQLELPARMVGHHQLLSCGSFGVNKRGDQAMLDVVAWAVRILKGITDQAHQHPFSPLAPLVLGGSHPHQLRTLREGCYGRSGLDRLRQPSQQLAAASEGGLDHLEAVQSPVPQQQNSFSHSAQQPQCGGALVEVVGPHPRLQHRVGGAFAYGDHPRLRPGARSAWGVALAEDPDVLWGVGQLEHGAVNSHKAQPEQERLRHGFGFGQRLGADSLEQSDKGPGSQPVAGLAQRPLAHPNRHRWVSKQPAHSAEQSEEDVGDAIVGVKVHRHAQDHHEGCGELAGAPLSGVALSFRTSATVVSGTIRARVSRETCELGVASGSMWRILSVIRWLLGEEGWWFLLHLTKKSQRVR